MGQGIARSEYTIAHAAAAANYTSALIGKWHLGDFWNKAKPSDPSAFANPGTMGFDEWWATEAQTSTSVPNCGCFPPANWTKPEPPPHFPVSPPSNFPHDKPGEHCIVGGGIYVNESFDCANYWFPNASDVARGGISNWTTKIAGDDGDFLLARFDNFVKRAVAGARPFLIEVANHYIHLPHPAMPAFFQAALPTGDPDYTGALAQWDHMVGRLLASLQTHGVANDTLIWITSDK